MGRGVAVNRKKWLLDQKARQKTKGIWFGRF